VLSRWKVTNFQYTDPASYQLTLLYHPDLKNGVVTPH